MYATVNDIELYYEVSGEAKSGTIILLHGWGQTHKFWGDLQRDLSKKYKVYAVDLPGFGYSQEPPATWNLHDYADFLHAFLSQKAISQPVIIGHSFGGRTAAAYAACYPVAKLVLYSNGGLPQAGVHKKIYRHGVVALCKYVFPTAVYWSHTVVFKPASYKNAVILTRQRARRMLDIYTQPYQDLESAFKKISAKTLIIAGKKDYIVQPQMGTRIQSLIKNAQLIEVPGATHFAHIEAPGTFSTALKAFLDSN